MHMIGHQHIGMDGAAIPGRRLRQPAAIEPIVIGSEEDRLAILAPLDDVQQLIGKEIAGEPSCSTSSVSSSPPSRRAGSPLATVSHTPL
jgi:hypothetical protein